MYAYLHLKCLKKMGVKTPIRAGPINLTLVKTPFRAGPINLTLVKTPFIAGPINLTLVKTPFRAGPINLTFPTDWYLVARREYIISDTLTQLHYCQFSKTQPLFIN